MRMRRTRWWKVFKIFPLAIVTLVVMLLWNWLLPALFGFHSINFAQAMGILVLSKILFGGWHRGFGYGMRHQSGWAFMTPEERAKMREKFGNRCWHDSESEKVDNTSASHS